MYQTDPSILSYDQFKEHMISGLKKRLGPEYQVAHTSTCKNNSVILDGIGIQKIGTSLCPNFYLEQSYKAYCAGKSLETQIKEIILKYRELTDRVALPYELQEFTFHALKDRIIYCLVSYASNKELLEDSPHIPYLDLAILFQYMVSYDKHGLSTIRITNDHMKLWNIAVEDLFYHARKNTPGLLPADVTSMAELLEFPLSSPMWVMTNACGLQGASCILYPDLLKNTAKKFHSGLFLIPSSIHEFLIVPAPASLSSTDIDAIEQEKDVLSEIVREINLTRLKPEDVLSDHAYYYNPTTEVLA